jgi:hypothetical protein
MTSYLTNPYRGTKLDKLQLAAFEQELRTLIEGNVPERHKNDEGYLSEIFLAVRELALLPWDTLHEDFSRRFLSMHNLTVLAVYLSQIGSPPDLYPLLDFDTWKTRAMTSAEAAKAAEKENATLRMAVKDGESHVKELLHKIEMAKADLADHQNGMELQDAMLETLKADFNSERLKRTTAEQELRDARLEITALKAQLWDMSANR